MATTSKSFTAKSAGTALLLKPTETANYSLSGTFDQVLQLEKSRDGGQTWEIVVSKDGVAASGSTTNLTSKAFLLRWSSVSVGGTPGTAVTSIATKTVGEKRIVGVDGAKVGATAGWTVNAAANTSLATCAAGETGATLVLPIPGLKVGDVVKGFNIIGQIESAGGAATLDADLRVHTAAAADVADASVGAIAQVAVTADTLLSEDTAGVVLADRKIAEGETLYCLLTATTASATDIAIQGAGIVTLGS